MKHTIAIAFNRSAAFTFPSIITDSAWRMSVQIAEWDPGCSSQWAFDVSTAACDIPEEQARHHATVLILRMLSLCHSSWKRFRFQWMFLFATRLQIFSPSMSPYLKLGAEAWVNSGRSCHGQGSLLAVVSSRCCVSSVSHCSSRAFLFFFLYDMFCIYMHGCTNSCELIYPI